VVSRLVADIAFGLKPQGRCLQQLYPQGFGPQEKGIALWRRSSGSVGCLSSLEGDESD